jgi:exodeoxyribonuclease VII large subunit
VHEGLRLAALRRVDRPTQRLDQAAAHLGRPSARTAQQHLRIERQAQRLRFAVSTRVRRAGDELMQRHAPRLQAALATRGRAAEGELVLARDRLASAVRARLERATRDGDRLALRLQLLDPRLVLQRGYALLTDAASGHPITSVRDAHAGQAVRAALADGEVDLRVVPDGTFRP